MWSDLPSPRLLTIPPTFVPTSCECSKSSNGSDSQLQMHVEPLEVTGNLQWQSTVRALEESVEADHRMNYSGDVIADTQALRQTLEQSANDRPYAASVATDEADVEAAPPCERRCSDSVRFFPRRFALCSVVPTSTHSAADQQRLLTAGFHLMHGYFRDDEPLVTLALNRRRATATGSAVGRTGLGHRITLAAIQRFRLF